MLSRLELDLNDVIDEMNGALDNAISLSAKARRRARWRWGDRAEHSLTLFLAGRNNITLRQQQVVHATSAVELLHFAAL